MGLMKACDLSDVEDGEIFKAEIDGVGPVAVYRVGDELFATDDTCTHGQASLADDGYIEDGKVICSWHDGAYDLRTGEPAALPCMLALKTYPVTVDGDEVFIEI